MRDRVREIAARDGRYSLEAYQFLYESLEYAVKRAGRQHAEGTERHVSGNELLEGMREYALHLFGPLAAQVWRSWGVKKTIDWGRIVFLLVDGQLLNRQDTDRVEDFEDGFDFDEAFVKAYRVKVPPEAVTRDPAGEA